MRLNYIYFLISLIVVLVVILVLLTTGSIPASTVPPTDSPTSARDVSVEHLDVQADATAIVSSTVPEPAVNQPLPQQDGPSLFKSHCAKCHTAQWFEKIKEPRSGWEGALSQMERLGVRLSETEKEILLDYLAGDGVP